MRTTSTSTIALFQRPDTPAGRRALSSRRLSVLAGAAAIVVALGLLFANPTPAAAIRDELVAGGAAAAILPATTKPEAVVTALRETFRGRVVAINAEAFPAVIYVTVGALDKETCAALLGTTARIEGLVVIDLEHYHSAADCRDSNDMTWRVMP
jgi:hypothetical protein